MSSRSTCSTVSSRAVKAILRPCLKKITEEQCLWSASLLCLALLKKTNVMPIQSHESTTSLRDPEDLAAVGRTQTETEDVTYLEGRGDADEVQILLLHSFSCGDKSHTAKCFLPHT